MLGLNCIFLLRNIIKSLEVFLSKFVHSKANKKQHIFPKLVLFAYWNCVNSHNCVNYTLCCNTRRISIKFPKKLIKKAHFLSWKDLTHSSCCIQGPQSLIMFKSDYKFPACFHHWQISKPYIKGWKPYKIHILQTRIVQQSPKILILYILLFRERPQMKMLKFGLKFCSFSLIISWIKLI